MTTTHPSSESPAEANTPRCMVAMPFREDWSAGVYSAIEAVMHSVRVNVFKVDTTKRTSVKLAADVENQVRGADVVVADLTGRNANVHVEVGLALASGKEILLCTQTAADVCAHLLDHLYVLYTPDPAGLEELSRQLRLRMQESLERARLEEETHRLRRQLSPTYSVECHRDRSIASLGKAFSNARRRIDILTTNLSWL
jgi:nucleoside 2-deoxyribosyltransferase